MLTAARHTRQSETKNPLSSVLFNCRVSVAALALIVPSAFSPTEANAQSNGQGSSSAPPLVEKIPPANLGKYLFSRAAANLPTTPNTKSVALTDNIAATTNSIATTSKTNDVKLITDRPVFINSVTSTPLWGSLDRKKVDAYGVNSLGNVVPVGTAKEFKVLGFLPIYGSTANYKPDGSRSGSSVHILGLRVWGNGNVKGDVNLAEAKTIMNASKIRRELPGIYSPSEIEADSRAARLAFGAFDKKVSSVSNGLPTSLNGGAITNSSAVPLSRNEFLTSRILAQ